MSMWEKLLIGAMGLLVILWMRPGIKASLANSRKATADDWRGLLLPIALVVAFVLLLIAMVRR